MRPSTNLLLLSIVLAGCESATDPGAATPFSGGSAAVVGQVVSVQLQFHEPVTPFIKRGDCPVAQTGFCGSGEVIPFGQATESIDFGGGCGGSCDLRLIQLSQGSLTLEETFSNPGCPGACQPNPSVPGNGGLTDVIVSGTGLFEGATGTLTGTVRAAGRESTVNLSGTLTLAR
jgi:hypothetical protein